MASGGGPRASGSGIAHEGKFRQRVDDHYRLMASAKKNIGRAGRLQLASAIGLGSAAGGLAVTEGPLNMSASGVCALLMLMSAICSRAATYASNYPAGSKDVESKAAVYRARQRLLTRLLLAAFFSAVYSVRVADVELPPAPITATVGAVGAICFFSSMYGMRAAAQLQRAFEDQKAKAKK
jgi:hypothetical protein